MDVLEDKIKKIKEDNDKLWEEFNQDKEAYWKQKHYIDWVEWQMKVKARKINEKDREERRKFAEQRDKEREKENQLLKYIGEIEQCNELISYLQGLKDDANSSAHKKEEEK